MIVIINGSFGIGKSTIAKLLRKSIPGSVIYDPEWAGSILMRLPRWIKLKGAGTDDFQDIELWRRLTIAGVRLFSWLSSGRVIVPMTFSRQAYLDEIVSGIKRHKAEAKIFCLKASLPTIHERLMKRGTKTEGPGSEWISRRVLECVEAHRDSFFGEPVDTEERSAREVAEFIMTQLNQTGVATA